MAKEGIHLMKGLMFWCQHNRVLDLEDLCTCLRHMTPNRMIRYLVQQCEAGLTVIPPKSAETIIAILLLPLKPR